MNEHSPSRHHSVRTSVTGGIVYPRVGSRLSRGRIGWPFARLVFGDDGIELVPRGVFAHIAPSIMIRYSQLDSVERRQAPIIGQLGGTLVFRIRNDVNDRISFTAPRSGFEYASQRLREMGV